MEDGSFGKMAIGFSGFHDIRRELRVSEGLRVVVERVAERRERVVEVVCVKLGCIGPVFHVRGAG